MPRFRIDYRNPVTGQSAVHEDDFEDWVNHEDGSLIATAEEVAHDLAYTLSDKSMGSVKITEVRG